jgi:PAS domain S-box-containing protein
VTLGCLGDRNQMFISALILLLAGVLPYVHARVHRALVESLTTRRARETSRRSSTTSATACRKRTRRSRGDRRSAEGAAGELVAAQKLRMHFERTPLAVIEWDREQRITAWNPAAEAIFGYDRTRRWASACAAALGRADRAARAMCDELLRVARGQQVARSSNATRGGRTIHCEWYNTPLVDTAAHVIGFASLVQDVTERLNTERTIHYMAHHDALTGLPNRRLMQDRLHQAIMARAASSATSRCSSSTSTASRS